MRSSRPHVGRIAALACLLAIAGLGLGAASTDSTRVNSSSRESFAQRRARLEAMSPAERDRLMRNQQRFQQLSASEQDQLRQLHASLEQDSQSEELKEVMRRYQDWLTTLPASQRAELPQLSVDERIERIKSLQAEERREKNRRLSLEDGKAFLAWMEKRVITVMSESEQKEYEGVTNPRDRREFIRAHMDQLRARNKLRPLTPDEIADLKQRLSPAAQQAMVEAQAEGRDKFARLLYAWVEQTRGGFDELRMLDVKKEDLAKYFDTLSERERDDLLALPPDEMWQRLSWRYRQDRIRRNFDRRQGGLQGQRSERRGSDRPGNGDRMGDEQRPGRQERLPARPAPPGAKRPQPGSV